jgi:hypothetical protein
MFFNFFKKKDEEFDSNKDETDDDKCVADNWDKNYRPRKSDGWSYYSGVKNIPQSSSPLDIFKKLWSDFLNDSIISETLKRENNLELNKKLFSFYIAAILIMGVVPQSHISHYWSRDPNGILGNTFIKNLSNIWLVSRKISTN